MVLTGDGDETNRLNHPIEPILDGSRVGRVAVATGVLGGAIAVAGGHPASAQEEPPRCIDAIQDPENAASGGWTLDTWNEFISGVEDGGDVIDGCAGDFGVGKLVINVINVLDKATGDPVDDTVDITKLLNAFQFGYEDIVAPSDTSRLEPYCDLRWTEVSQADNDEETARQNVSNFVDVGDFRFDETGFGGRPLRFLHWVGGVDDPVIPISTTNSRSTRSCSAGRATRTTTRSRHRRSLTSAAATSSWPDATPD